MNKSHLAKSIRFYNDAVECEKVGNLKSAEELYFKAIKINSTFFQAHYNLANVKKKVDELDEAIIHFKKSIELKSDFINAYYNLGDVLKDLGRLKEAEQNFKKALELNPNFKEAKVNLGIIFELNKLISIVKPSKKNKNDLNFISNVNTFRTNRDVEPELINELYNIRTDELDKTSSYDARYGHGKFSNFKLFENNSVVIKKIKADLTTIMEQAVKSEIYIKESFFNILKSGSGLRPHTHFGAFDKNIGYENQKFSLTYYLSIGDQKTDEPGILKFYDPKKEILPTNGLLLIFPANQKHSSIYNGKEDRIMIGVNFYSLN